MQSAFFKALVLLTLSIAVGVNAITLGLLDHLMFKPLGHVLKPERLVHIDTIRNYPAYLTLREKSRSMDISAYWPQTLSFERGPGARRVDAEFVSHSYFDVLGARPEIGRWFTEDEETPASLSPVAILSYDFWQRQFNGDSSILGKTAWIMNGEYRIAGVAPRGFTGALVSHVDLWLPMSSNPAIGVGNLVQPRSGWHYTIGRLRDGFTFEQAVEEGSVFLKSGELGLAGEFLMRPLNQVRVRGLTAQDRRVVTWLSAAAAVLLLIACVNVAGLIQVGFVGCLLLAALSAAGGVMFSLTVAPVVREFFVTQTDAAELLGPRTFAIIGLLALLSVLMIRIVPSMRSWQRSICVVVQVAVTLVLLIGSGLFIRSLGQARQVEYGVKIDGIFVVTPNLVAAGYSPRDANALSERLLERAQSLPDVDSAALDVSTPFGAGLAGGFLPVGGGGSTRNALPVVHIVSPGYLETLGTKVLEGRSLNNADAAGAKNAAMVSRRTALEYWPGKTALGKCLMTFTSPECFEVVGVVENTRWRVQGGASPPEVFVTLEQGSTAFPAAAVRALIFQTGGGSAAAARIVADLRSAVQDLPYMTAVPLWSMLDSQTREWRLGATLFGFLGLVALLLTAAGLLLLDPGQALLLVSGGLVIGIAAELALRRYVEELLFNISPTDPVTFIAASLIIAAVALAVIQSAPYFMARKGSGGNS